MLRRDGRLTRAEAEELCIVFTGNQPPAADLDAYDEGVLTADSLLRAADSAGMTERERQAQWRRLAFNGDG